jgi:hypothetical protein
MSPMEKRGWDLIEEAARDEASVPIMKAILASFKEAGIQLQDVSEYVRILECIRKSNTNGDEYEALMRISRGITPLAVLAFYNQRV